MAARSWQNFYLLTGTGAATLTGLMFIAVTFGSSLVTKKSETMARAFTNPTFNHFVQILLIACLLTVPTMTSTVLGFLLVVLGMMRLVPLFGVYKQLKRAHEVSGDLEMSDWLFHVVFPLLSYILLLITGIGFGLGRPEAFNGLAIFTFSLLTLGIQGAWELLVWMAMNVNGSRDTK